MTRIVESFLITALLCGVLAIVGVGLWAAVETFGRVAIVCAFLFVLLWVAVYTFREEEETR
jgi:hypothetical protein